LQHYDIPDPQQPDQFMERYWLPHNRLFWMPRAGGATCYTA
jgi:hypothetical protein